MIGLNKIWLNQVQLNRLYLNAPFPVYRKMTGGGSSGDGFPVLPGDVTRWHFGGLTNEMMAAMDDPRLEDADGKGRFLSFKNFAWSGMSGAGGYNQNFNQWGYGNLPPALQTYTPHKMELNIPSTLRTGNVYSNLGKEGDIYDFTLKIVGLKDGASLRITKGVVSGNIERIEKDGIYKIYQPLETSWDQLRIYIVISNPNSIDLNITIEQLPLYPGALVFDGVDDCGVCDNFPILNKDKGYTVVALRQWINENTGQYFIVNRDSFIMETNLNNRWISTSFSNSNNFITLKQLPFVYQSTYSYNGETLNNVGSNNGSNVLTVCCNNYGIGSFSGYANVAIWELVFLDHDATEEELTKIKDYFVKTYPWLFPDQAWTVTGKTNEDEDRATIANITGNGNDLLLLNFGFAEGSGYNEEGEYAGYLVTDEVDDRVISRSFTLNKDWTIVGNWKMLQPEANKLSGIVKQNSLFIYNHVDGLNISINDAWNFFKLKDIRSVNAICSDGRIYLNDWTEIIDSKQQTVNESVGTLVIGILGNVYTSLAFKNLGFYNNQILSKDDCIKAYNYLQTLKAK